ncbi:DUF262 domain-containing protein [Kordia sp.]|uniref:DUF262 domain-containing protein n=1 Tax=Kordia sp. TaxID=1965332 RepID=UPI003D2AC5A9
MNNILKLKTINELKDYQFLIPAYQRGYRWTKNQVIDLLEDISTFTPKQLDNNKKTWYCLQPIVIKKKQDSEEYEVIDGQQRLTTIYIILFYLNQYYAEGFKQKLFQLNYETRENSEKFLKELGGADEYDNIDFYYISNTYYTIEDWFKNKDNSFNRNDFESNFNFNTKVIWYESIEKDSVAIFTRINIGKIPLTNAELIKALFLNSSNFSDINSEKLKLRQLEIATEWDNVERALQKDSFWYFLTGNKRTTNRIEFIFNLMNDEFKKDDKYSTFRYFQKKFNNDSTTNIDSNWHEIKKRFQRFSEWFDERDLYHKIGYLVCIDHIDIKKLYNDSNEMSKSEFNLYLDKLICDSIKNVNLHELQYEDKDNVRKTLLLYNIVTMLKSDKDNSYFPFHLFKNNDWDIEHITSIKSNMPDKNRENWLNDAKVFIDPEIDKKGVLIRNINSFNSFNDNDKFKILYEKIINHFNHYLKDMDINDISNLTLLDSKTNRGYKNAAFPIKRNTIIKRDKEGVFIPICTKNVFLKYFSEYPPKISFWTEEDRLNYEKDLDYILSNYLKK